jgi:DNA-directed RNA polymerase specialized sigma24 family protein
MATPSDRWTLNQSALASLIERLGQGDAREYEVVRRKLIAFLDLRGAARPEVAADETLDRVARKIEEGVAIESLRAYVFGVARRVLLESERRERRERIVQETWVLLHHEPDASDAETQRRLACLGKCLKKLSAENRALIEAYHGSTRGPARSGREALAARLGLSEGALRTRAHRIRNELGACARRCLAGTAGNE